MAHVLIVDDEQSICWGLSKLVRSLGHTAAVAPSAEQAFAGGSIADARRDRPRRAAAGPRWAVGHAAVPRAMRARADHHHHGLRRSGHRGRGRAQRGVRVSRQTVRSERGPARDPTGFEDAGASLAAGRRARRRASRRRAWSARRRRFKRCSSGSRSSRRPRRASISAAKAARARSWSPGRSTSTAGGATGRSCRSTWRRSALRWPRASCSATPAGRSPAPSRRGRGCWSRPTAARCSSTRWPTSRCRSR